jgi:hypothetical protein
MTVYRYVRLGMLPATKIGASWHIDPPDLARFRDGGHATPRARRGKADWKRRLEARMLVGD